MIGDKPDGYYLDLLPIEPAQLAGGERTLVVMSVFLTAFLTFMLGMRLPSFWIFFVCGAGVGLCLLEVTFFAWMWRIDNQLSQTFFRFMDYGQFIPAHSLSSASDIARLAQRRKKHLKR